MHIIGVMGLKSVPRIARFNKDGEQIVHLSCSSLEKLQAPIFVLQMIGPTFFRFKLPLYRLECQKQLQFEAAIPTFKIAVLTREVWT